MTKEHSRSHVRGGLGEIEACGEVCPCCKQRHCLEPEDHREYSLADKRHWHRCTSNVCPVW